MLNIFRCVWHIQQFGSWIYFHLQVIGYNFGVSISVFIRNIRLQYQFKCMHVCEIWGSKCSNWRVLAFGISFCAVKWKPASVPLKHWHCIPDDRILHSHSCGNFNSSALTIKIIVPWDMNPCSLVHLLQHFGGTNCLCLHSRCKITLLPWRWRQYVHPHCWCSVTLCHFRRWLQNFFLSEYCYINVDLILRGFGAMGI